MNNMLIFTDNETHTEISYVIARLGNKQWYHYLDFPNIEDAKEILAKVREKHPDIKFGLFEKIEKSTVNMLNEEFV